VLFRGHRREISSLKSVKSQLERLPISHAATATAVGPGVGQAREQIPIICRNIDDAVRALRTGRDPSGNRISASLVGDGLRRLADDASGPAFSGLMLTVLSPDGVQVLKTAIDELSRAAERLRGVTARAYGIGCDEFL
jgi:hypothetical protein